MKKGTFTSPTAVPNIKGGRSQIELELFFSASGMDSLNCLYNEKIESSQKMP